MHYIQHWWGMAKAALRGKAIAFTTHITLQAGVLLAKRKEIQQWVEQYR